MTGKWGQTDPQHFVAAGDVAAWRATERGIEACLSNTDAAEGDLRLRLDVLAADTLRLDIRRSSADPAGERPTCAVLGDALAATSAPHTVRDCPECLQIHTGAVTITVHKAPFSVAAHRKADGSVIFETADVLNRPAAYQSLNDEFLVARRSRPEDMILGLGEKTGRMDRNGRDFTLWNTDVLNPNTAGEFSRVREATDPRGDPFGVEFDPYYISIPFFHHLDARTGHAAGFFLDNGHRARYEFDHDDHYRIHFSGGGYTEYIFAGPDLKGILARYAQLTGHMPAPPVWALGHHQCRWHQYTQADTLALAANYRDRVIPCDGLWLDIDHMDGYRVFTWNAQAYPEPRAMLHELGKQGFRTVGIVDPGVKSEPGNAVFEAGLAQDVFCRTRGGALYTGQVWPGRTVFPDFSLPEARAWWGALNAAHIEAGMAGIWNDMNEPATGDVPDAAMRFDRGRVDHDALHNQYATLMAMATREGLLAAAPDRRTFILSRAGSAGIQRYAANWLGDNMSRWDHLRLSIPMSLGLGLSGQPFVGADIGGFGETCTPELLARWIQCGALTPFCRNHNAAGNGDQYPWTFGPEVEAVYRESVTLRYRLMPTLYAAFMEASETGLPVQRPLALEFQDDPVARGVDDQYLLGEHLLVAPIYRPGERSRVVTLPAGNGWHAWDGAVFDGGRCLTVEAGERAIPMFVRAGAVLPLWPEAPPSALGHQPEVVELHVFVPDPGLGGGVASMLHEDDGETFAFQRGAYRRTHFHVSRTGDTLTLSATVSGAGYPQFRRTEFVVRFHGVTPSQVLCHGRDLPVIGDSVTLPNAGEGFRLIARFDEASSGTQRGR